jgi:arylsulfatase A-like enzyme
MWEYGRNAKFFGYPKLPDDRSPSLAIRDGDWKLLVNADGENAELYNLATDPSEAKNVAEANPDVAARLKSEILKWRKSMPSTIRAAPSNE